MEKDLEAEVFRGPPVGDEAGKQETQHEEKSLEESLQEQLQKQQEESQKNYDHYLRALADVENIKKRTQREREEYLKYANVSFIKKLLPVIDDLHRAIDVASKSKDFEVLSKGIEMTARSLDDLLKGEGVVAIDSLGKPFDPQYHQALTVEPSDEHPENTVIEQLQKGYTLHDRVIRPSLVKVSN
ncbi:MAG: nucleotide exchange factor GrpE [Syntrophomonas sp.]|nr:nucleotide exchange factor GrpE [Syntrophomonas sp.]